MYEVRNNHIKIDWYKKLYVFTLSIIMLNLEFSQSDLELTHPNS